MIKTRVSHNDEGHLRCNIITFREISNNLCVVFPKAIISLLYIIWVSSFVIVYLGCIPRKYVKNMTEDIAGNYYKEIPRASISSHVAPFRDFIRKHKHIDKSTSCAYVAPLSTEYWIIVVVFTVKWCMNKFKAVYKKLLANTYCGGQTICWFV